ncbi:MAG: type II secretion system protein [Alphaproteobacteria bacterium]|nr:type II secretion system protein [Alphaproteobacteria bacterium]
MTHKTSPASKQSGRSMIEMLGVLAIVGILSVTAIKSISKAMHKHKMNRETENIITTIQTIHLLGANEKNYLFVSVSKNQWNQSLPNTFNYNPWESNLFGGKYKYGSHHPFCDSNNDYCYPKAMKNKAFLFGITHVDPTFCMELLTINWTHFAGGLIGMSVSDNNEHMRAGVNAAWCQNLHKNNETTPLYESEEYRICPEDMPLNPQQAAEVCYYSDKAKYIVTWKYW